MTGAAAALQDDGPSRGALARHVLRFDRALASRMATHTARLPFGTALMSPDIRWVFHLSQVEVTRPVAAVELFDPVAAMFDQAGLVHRRVTTVRPEVAWTLAPQMHERGWEAERLVFMVHDRITTGPVSPLGFAAVDHQTWAACADAFVADHEWGKPTRVQLDMARRDRRLADRIDVEWVLSSEGTAGCHVYRHGRIAQIENVHVLSQARGQGLGQGLMAKAMAVCADAEVVFLVADADDWPRNWYANLGFRPVASGWGWLLDPGSAAS